MIVFSTTVSVSAVHRPPPLLQIPCNLPMQFVTPTPCSSLLPKPWIARPDPGSSPVHRTLLARIERVRGVPPPPWSCLLLLLPCYTSRASVTGSASPLFAAPLFLFCSSLSIILKFSEIHVRRIMRCRPPCMPPRTRGAALCREASTPASGPVPPRREKVRRKRARKVLLSTVDESPTGTVMQFCPPACAAQK